MWSDCHAESHSIAGNALLNRVYHEVQEIPWVDFQSGEAAATETGLEGLGASVNYPARSDRCVGFAVEVDYEPQYPVTTTGMQVR